MAPATQQVQRLAANGHVSCLWLLKCCPCLLSTETDDARQRAESTELVWHETVQSASLCRKKGSMKQLIKPREICGMPGTGVSMEVFLLPDLRRGKGGVGGRKRIRYQGFSFMCHPTLASQGCLLTGRRHLIPARRTAPPPSPLPSSQSSTSGLAGSVKRHRKDSCLPRHGEAQAPTPPPKQCFVCPEARDAAKPVCIGVDPLS